MTRVVDPGLLAPRARPGTLAGVAPGSNRRGVLSQADWRFLLTHDGRSDVLLLGFPHPAVLDALSRLGRRIVVLTTMQRRKARDGNVVSNGSVGNVETVHLDRTDMLPLPSGAFDLIVAPAVAAGAPRCSARLLAELARIVGASGRVYIEGSSVRAARIERAWTRLSGAGAEIKRFWLVRRRGELRAAIPLEDVPALGAFFFGDVLYGKSRLGRLLSPVAGWLARRRVLHRLLPSRAVVLHRKPGAQHPFDDLVALGRRHGLDLSRHRSALLARGSYDSNKVAVYFFDRASGSPDVIVKLTRTPEFNQRLEAEYSSLRRLRELDAVPPGTYPEPLFLDVHGGVAVVAQKVVAGAPFRVRTTGRSDCPIARDAIGWITRLAVASVDTDAVSPLELSTRLTGTLDELAAVYTLSPAERQFLQSRIAVVAEWTGSTPMVFRHGDAGAWNVLVVDGGKAAFLDWEAAESLGPPLWDLFDFIRSFGTWIGRTKGKRNQAEIYHDAFLGSGSLAALQRDTVRRYAAAIGLPTPLVEPLFYACWMQRAVREAAWATGRLEEATYINLLRLCIRGRRSPGLRWLLD